MIFNNTTNLNFETMHTNLLRVLLLATSLFTGNIVSAQQQTKMSWQNPIQQSFETIEGRICSQKNVTEPYSRLPSSSQKELRKELWNLSLQSAGLKINFRTSSPQITIKYKLGGGFSMPHMPSTGVSGVDLYARTNNQYVWMAGKYAFGDTTTWRYSRPTNIKEMKDEAEYTLYLPLYNQVKWLEIGVADTASFAFGKASAAQPIVVYGTSIAQGACASRPGMAWTSIVERSLKCPLINLGFSGNGRLEPEMLRLLSTIDAKLFVLDCLPNLTITKPTDKDKEELIQKIVSAVRIIRSNRPQTPILLTEHAGYGDNMACKDGEQEVLFVNHALQMACKQLKQTGIKNLYVLTQKEIGLTMDSTVDGIHPSDLGMMTQAQAYNNKIKTILK